MTDEEFVLKEDIKDKKRTARGSYNKVRNSRKNMKTPSDYLSKKEKDALNGECKIYAIVPMKWDEFKKMPEGIKIHYVTTLRERYGDVPCTEFSKMFGHDNGSVSKNFKALGLTKRTSRPKYDQEGWRKFAFPDASEDAVEILFSEEPEKPSEEPNYDDISKLLKAVKEMGGSITITINI